MKKKKMKRGFKLLIVIFVIIIIFVLGSIFLFKYLVSPVDKNGGFVEFQIETGQNSTMVFEKLEEKELIRSSFITRMLYRYLGGFSIDAGYYRLSPSMNTSEILDEFKNKRYSSAKVVSVTFVEGKNMRYVINTITENFKLTEKDILDTLKDTSYIDTLIEKYWFLSSEIKNKNIYYTLEGYLYPDTYEFYDNDTTKDIFKKMLDNMEAKLKPYKKEVEKSDYTFHEMITLASIIEQEAGTSNDRKGVAGVFYNRLEHNWSLGSDVTTYYAEKLELWSRDLYLKEINDCNSYNTRASCMAGKLPVGPICNPSINSLIATIEPEKSNYYYFVADSSGKTYFNKTASAHSKTVSKLKSEGKWYQY